MKQKQFIFSKQFSKTYNRSYIPTGYLDIEDEFKDQMLRQGYIVKDIRRIETITVSCIAAKANISLKERIKFQKDIN
jgi:hypothetical protein